MAWIYVVNNLGEHVSRRSLERNVKLMMNTVIMVTVIRVGMLLFLFHSARTYLQSHA